MKFLRYFLYAIFFFHTIETKQYTTFLKQRPISIQEQYFNAPTQNDTTQSHDFYTWISFGSFIEQSIAKKSLASLFSLNGYSTISFDTNGTKDINPFWMLLGDETLNYKSDINWNLSSQKSGALFLGYLDFQDFFVEIDTAFLQSKTKMIISEKTDTLGLMLTPLSGKAIQSASDAFSNPDWNYGKLYGTQKKYGFDNIQAKLGKQFASSLQNFSYTITPYISCVLPTGIGSTSEQIFEPQVGSNNLSMGGGIKTSIQTEKDITASFDCTYRYEFQAEAWRSFDLKNNGKWSRYMMVASKNILYRELALPAINLLTQKCIVLPGHQFSFNTHLEKEYNFIKLISHYNLFYRQQESILSVDTLPNNFGIFDITQTGGNVTSASKATINGKHVDGNYTSDPAFITIKDADLNLQSACSPTMLTSSFMIGCGFDFDPVFIQLHLSYEHPHFGSFKKISAWANLQWNF